MKQIILPAARDDILRQFRYYLIEQDSLKTANRFLEAVARAVEKILLTPNAGAPKLLSDPSLAGLRSWPVEEFEDIRIYDLAQRDEIRITRVSHGKRDITRILDREE